MNSVKFEVQLVDGQGADKRPGLSFMGSGHEVAYLDQVRGLPGSLEDTGDQIELQQDEIGQILPGEKLAAQVGVNEPETPETRPARSFGREGGETDAFLGTDEHVLHYASSINDNADLSRNLP